MIRKPSMWALLFSPQTDWFGSNPRDHGARSRSAQEVCVRACSYLTAWLSLGPKSTGVEKLARVAARSSAESTLPHPSGCHNYEDHNKGRLQTNMQPRNKRCVP